MICYRDRTYCTSWPACQHAASCDRPLTESVIEAARKAGFGDRIDMMSFRGENCFKEIEQPKPGG